MAILDQYGKPYTPQKRADTRQITVAAIRDRFSGYPSRGLTPGKLGTLLKEADQGFVYRQMELFEEMEEKDLHLSSVLQTRKLAVMGLEYDILPANDTPDAKRAVEIVEQNLASFDDWEDMLLDMMDALPKGYSISELFYDYSENQNHIIGYHWIHPKYTTFLDIENNHIMDAPRILVDDNPSRGIDMQPNKFLYHRYKARSGWAMRQGLMRGCAWMYLFKNYDIKDWVVFAEVWGQPLRLGRYDPNTSPEDKATLIEAVAGLGADAAAVISKSTEIEFPTPSQKSASADIYEKLAVYCDKQMSKGVLGQTATADETAGKLGGSPEKESVRQDILESDAKAAQKTLRRDLFRSLIGFNMGWDKVDNTPYIQLKYAPPADLKSDAKLYEILLKKVGVKTSLQHVREHFGIPMLEGDEETIGGITERSFDLPLKLKDIFPAKTAGLNIPDAALAPQNRQAVLDRLGDNAVAMSAGKFKAAMKPILDIIASGATLEEMKARIVEALAEVDTSELEDLVAKSVYLANLFGRASVKGDKGIGH